MKLVVDTNIIFSAIVKDSISRRLITHSKDKLFTISITDVEIEKYRADIISKAGITEEEFEKTFWMIHDKMSVIDDRIILTRWNEAFATMKNIDAKDAPFIAAALAIGADIWSDDNHFDKQTRVKVWKTKDIARL